MRWNIKRRIIAAMLLMLALILLGFTLMESRVTVLHGQDQWVEKTRAIINQSEHYLSDLQDIEAGKRGYLISGIESFLEPYDAGNARLPRDMSALRQMVAHNPAQLALLDEVAKLGQRKIDVAAEAIRLRRTSGFEAARHFMLTAGAKNIMDAIRQKMARFNAEEQRLLAKRQTAAAQTDAESHLFLLAMDGILVVLALVLLLMLHVTVVRPIRRLQAVVQKLGKGDFEVRADVRGRDEIAELGRSFNQMAEAIVEQAARSEGVIKAMVDGVITIDTHGIVESFNPAAEAIFGYQPGEVIGNNVNMLMPEPHKGQHDGYLKHYLDTGEAKVIGIGRTVEGRRKDGSTFPLDLAVNEMVAGELRSFIGTVRDISERVATEQEIAKKNEELQIRGRYDQSYGRIMALFSSTHNRKKALSAALSILADNHPIPVSAIYEQDEWQGILTCTASHGTPETLKQSFEPGEGLIGQAALENKVIILNPDTGDSGMNIETGIINFKPATVVASPINYQEKVLGVLVLAASKPPTDLDTPFIERLSDQIGVAINNIRQYSDLQSMSEQLKKRGEEITQKNLQLEESNKMKSEFLANMSHELRTPLNAIIGFSEVLKDGVTGELSEEQNEYIGDIFDSGQHLLSLINDILDLSKIEAGKMELELMETDVTDLLNNSLSIVKERAMTHRVKLSQDIGKDVDTCWMDVRKAKQIIFNLLSNAVKFTPDGGSVSLSARKAKGEAIGSGKNSAVPLTPPTSSEGGFLEISVTDTGIGISDEDQQKLFNAFVQADSSLSRKYEGTGLGLVMVKRLAELHGGTVGMKSEEGKGSTFTVWLPYRTGDAATGTIPVAKAPAEQISSKTGPLSVLVVEDEDAAADLMRIQLETAGYHTTRAATAEEAMEMLAEAKPDLITLDILLPGMDGWDFLAEIKRDKTLAHIPVVIVSIVADEKKGFSLGATEVLQKPVRKRALLTAVGQAGFGLDGGVSGTVLVVDDDSKAVEVVARHMEDSGATVLRAYGGTEAIDNAKSKKPDLIILDLMMPEVNGFDVVEALKANEETAHIPIIILTAKVITDADRKALNGGVLKIVEKSGFNHGSFINEVHRATAKLAAESAQSAPKPARKKPSGTKKSSPASAATPSGKATVLVVEDNARESNLLKHYLEDAGYAVTLAANGPAALDEMRQSRPDLITLDMMMPDMDGFEFLNEKANLPECMDIPVLIVSGMDDAEKGLSLGANAIVRKPIKKRDFLDVIKSIDIKSQAGIKPDVLVVDDDPKAVKIISSYFDASTYQVVKAYDGAEALEAVERNRPDLIVLNLTMPVMNGFEVIDRLKKDKKTRDIPIIVLTAKILTGRERQKLMRHVQAIKEKGSFNRDRFLTEVETLLGRIIKK